jgi:tRNA-dihydrouridine synthase B
MKLGPFEIEHPFILAPMAGITNSPYRRFMRRMKSSIVISELVSANGLEYGNPRTHELFHFEEDERIVGLQIFGERPELLVKACQHVEELGADFVDLNLGCPVQKVVKKGAGSAMCREPQRLRKVLEWMVKSVSIPVTIKIRTGWNSQEMNAHEVIQAAYDAGVAWVAVHGRTRAQGYDGLADWDFIAELKSKAKLPIIGNGDLTTAQKSVERIEQSGVDAVMIGRGALRNPFIFDQSDLLWRTGESWEPTKEDYFEAFEMQKSYLSAAENKHLALVQAKKFLSWYAAGFPHNRKFRKEVFELRDFEDVWKMGFDYFEQHTQDRDWGFLSEGFLMGGHG